MSRHRMTSSFGKFQLRRWFTKLGALHSGFIFFLSDLTLFLRDKVVKVARIILYLNSSQTSCRGVQLVCSLECVKFLSWHIALVDSLCPLSPEGHRRRAAPPYSYCGPGWGQESQALQDSSGMKNRIVAMLRVRKAIICWPINKIISHVACCSVLTRRSRGWARSLRRWVTRWRARLIACRSTSQM